MQQSLFPVLKIQLMGFLEALYCTQYEVMSILKLPSFRTRLGLTRTSWVGGIIRNVRGSNFKTASAVKQQKVLSHLDWNAT